MIKKAFYLSLLLLALFYGVMIGKYRVFPYELFKSLQDISEEQISNPLESYVYTQNDLEALISVKPDNIDSLRNVLRDVVFGSKSLPELLPVKVFDTSDDFYSDLKNLDKIEQFEINQAHGLKSIGYIFHPNAKNNRLIIYHQGHSGGFNLGKNTIQYFLKKGFTIYALAMPLKGKNNHPVIEVKKIGKIHLENHEELKYLDNPLQYFVAPVVAMVNYAKKQNYNEIAMIGISGGGWTTTVTAALDPRINYSFPVAGTYPMFVRYSKPSRNYGDFEQTHEDLYQKVNYLDMYIMGATGKNRYQFQILNKYDSCCFEGDDYKKYVDFVSEKVSEFGSGKFLFYSDTSHKQHKISDIALEQIDDVLSTNHPN
ncbi:alpha/beta hydrolase family protein [Zobellia galactanivorans]|uniref:Conserved hypothetical membrane protein n=1 Tax=Zobellia galactanivorans (strain DSM 12802 / CCUG 47099 / CIP 106680 / NCIMB 13871 / Dsij) TaxID=63186 RepID=G0L1U7_ZOBGA|nr:hypothetical protein [Zobellia galactanivorans]CAZ97911.1 Conserved hypothetical membrane protein [Zobellia galactanivorans]